MKNTKTTSSNFCSQLWSSWIRVDSSYLQNKKDQKEKK